MNKNKTRTKNISHKKTLTHKNQINIDSQRTMKILDYIFSKKLKYTKY